MKENNIQSGGKSSEVETKRWKVQMSDGIEATFYPVFVTQDLPDAKVMSGQAKEVECKMVHINLKASDGTEIKGDIGFQELYMFVYYCANEEIRQNLQMRQMKHISQIPYEVTFKLSESEIQAKMAKRLILLPVDEIQMAIARSEAQMLKGKATLGSLEAWFHDKQRLAKRSK